VARDAPPKATRTAFAPVGRSADAREGLRALAAGCASVWRGEQAPLAREIVPVAVALVRIVRRFMFSGCEMRN
jgi:hypothetical protein